MTTLNDWTNDSTAIASAKKVLQGETFKLMMEVMQSEMPLTKIPLPFGAAATDYAYAHGMQKGYDYALRILKAMGESSPELPQEPEATFSAKNRL